jgi:hypothetical protein
MCHAVRYNKGIETRSTAMTRKINDNIMSIRLGALYRFAAARKLSRETVESIMTDRARMSAVEANRLAAHWFGTWHFRRAS